MALKITPQQDITIYDDYFSYTGTSDADRIYIYGHHDTIDGADGNDYIFNRGSYGFIKGGAGDDQIVSSFQHDNLFNGGAGNDYISLSNEVNDTVLGGSGVDFILSFSGHENLLNGGVGNDTIVANGTYNDTLIGGAGDDVLSVVMPDGWHAPEGAETVITGGFGNDIFEFYGSGILSAQPYNSYSTVTDFSVMNDVLVFKTSQGAHLLKEDLDVSFVDGSAVIAFADPSYPGLGGVPIEYITLVGIDENEWAQVNVG